MKTIYVLGAGASAASEEAPLGSELVWMYHMQTAAAVPLVNGRADTSNEDAEYANLEKFFLLVGQIYPELASEYNKWKNRGYYMYTPPTFGGGKKEYFVDDMLRVLIQQGHDDGVALVRKLICEHIIRAGRGNSRRLYETFVEMALKSASPDEVAIISFNFDCFLNPFYRRDIYFNYGVTFDSGMTEEGRIGLSLLKPHGSMDWGICGKCGKTSLRPFNYAPGSYGGKTCQAGCGGSVEPLLILPHQPSASSMFDQIWNKSRQAIHTAEQIIIVGYSFPQYDEAVTKLFEQELRPDAMLTIVDVPRENETKDVAAMRIKREYVRRFPKIKNAFNINMGGFESFVNDTRTSEEVRT